MIVICHINVNKLKVYNALEESLELVEKLHSELALRGRVLPEKLSGG